MFTTGLEFLMEKLALRAGFRAMQRAGAQGNAASVADIWKQREKWMKTDQPGQQLAGGTSPSQPLQPARRGTQLSTIMSTKEKMQGGKMLGALGGGGEGVADMVLHPEHGLAARKTYSPTGLATPETIARKEQMGRTTDPAVARFFGRQSTPQGSGTMHFNELVAGRGQHAEPAVGTPEHRAALEKTHAATQAMARRSGFSGGAQDVRDANMVWDSHTGQYKTVDAIPAHAGEFIPRDVHGNDARTGKLPAESAGHPDDVRRRMLMAHPDAAWTQSPMSPKAPINALASGVNEEGLRGQMGLPSGDPRLSKADRQQQAQAAAAHRQQRVQAMMGGAAPQSRNEARRLRGAQAEQRQLEQNWNMFQQPQQQSPAGLPALPHADIDQMLGGLGQPKPAKPMRSMFGEQDINQALGALG